MKTGILVSALFAFVVVCGAKSASGEKSPEVAILSDGKSTTAETIPAAASFLQPLGAQPSLGRDFLAEDFRKGSTLVAIISSEFWSAAFGTRPDILGRTIRVDDHDFIIVGVAPRKPSSLEGRKVWVVQQN